MKFALSAALLSLAGLATAGSILPRKTCSETDSFGSLAISNTNNATSYRAGDTISVYADFTCVIAEGIIPKLLSYAIVTVPNGGDPKTFVLASRDLPSGATSQNFTIQIPTKYIFPTGTLYDFVLTEYSVTNNTQTPLTNPLQVTVPIAIISA